VPGMSKGEEFFPALGIIQEDLHVAKLKHCSEVLETSLEV